MNKYEVGDILIHVYDRTLHVEVTEVTKNYCIVKYLHGCDAGRSSTLHRLTVSTFFRQYSKLERMFNE